MDGAEMRRWEEDGDGPPKDSAVKKSSGGESFADPATSIR
jgi:hypothetical protein